jgi:hypothetical protein
MDGFDILGQPGAVLVKTFKGADSVKASMFANARYDLADPVTGFRLRGLTIDAASLAGPIFGQYAEQEMRDLIILNYAGKLFPGGGPEGQHMYFENITAKAVPYDYTKGTDQPSGTGCAGWRPKCGGGKMVRSWINCGDDGLQLVPAGATEDPMFNGPDLEFWYEDCHAESNTARPLGAGMQTGNQLPNGDTSAGMRINVRGGWLRCTGTAGGSCVNVANHHGLGSLTVEAIGCEVWQDGRLGSRGQHGEVNVITYPGLTKALGPVSADLEVIIHSGRVPKPKSLVDVLHPELTAHVDTSKVLLAA